MNLKVLIVDDEYFVRMGLRQTIDWEGLGFLLVGEAENGVQALSLIRERQPDIVITDIKMPKMDGIELIAAIGEQGYPCEIILLSGYEEFSYAKKAIEHGVSAYLLKPTKNEDLIAALLKLKSKFAERQALENLRGDNGPEVFERLHSRRFLLLPYQAVGQPAALLLAMKPDKMLVDGREEKEVLIGIAPGRISTPEGCQAILG